MADQRRSSTRAGPCSVGSARAAARPRLPAVVLAAFLLTGCTAGAPPDGGPGTVASPASPTRVETTAEPSPGRSTVGPTTSPAADRLCDTEVTSANPVLRGVRFGRHDTFDRLAFDFCAPAEPTLTATVVEQLVEDGSGNEVRLDGAAFFALTLRPADAHSETGEPTVPDQPVTVAGNFVQQYKRIGDFEGTVTYGVGVRRVAETATAIQTDPKDPRHIVLTFDLGPQVG